jgi:hypothetical protein
MKDFNALINLCAKDNERLIDLYADRTLRKSLVADIEVREDMLPTVNRHDGLIAFRGHIVSIHDGEQPSLVCYPVATFDADEPELASEYEVRAYIDCDFREELLTAKTFDDISALCPKFVKIPDDQGLRDIKITWNGKDLDIAFVLYGALGRVLFKNHQFDKMQFMLWLWDESGTGKTVIRNVIRAFFARSLRTQISFKSSGDFGLEKLPDKAFIMWKDVGKEARKDFPISAAEVKNLIDGGEEMDVNQKGIKAIDEDVTGSHLVDANCPWTTLWKGAEDQKALANRVMAFRFGTAIEDGDEALIDEILTKEADAVLVLLVRAYQFMRQNAAGAPFSKWQIPYFADERNLADPMFAFLKLTQDDADTYAVHQEDSETTQRDLLKAVKEWHPRFDPDRAKLEQTLGKINEDLPGDGYVLHTPGGTHWYQCVHCNQDVEYDAGNGFCCGEYNDDERPKTHRIAANAKAKKKRVLTADRSQATVIKNMRLVTSTDGAMGGFFGA